VPAPSKKAVAAKRGLAGIGLSVFNPSSVNRLTDNYITNTFNTGHLIGDIRRCFLSDVTTGSVTGPELVTNGDFATNSDWTLEAGSTISGGALNVVAPGSSVVAAQQSVTFVPGRMYQFTFTLTGSGSGLSINIPGASGVARNAAGTYTQFMIPTGTGELIVSHRLGAGWTGTVDNISVREVIADRSYKAAGANIYGTLTASAVNTGNSLVAYSGFSGSNYLQEPYSADLDFGTGEWTASAWVNVPTTWPAGSFPVVGSELVTNGTFDTDLSGWTAQFTSTNSWQSGRLRVISSVTNAGETSQAITCVVGKTYKVTGSIYNISTSGRISVNSIPYQTNSRDTGYQNTGDYSFLFQATSTTMYVVCGNASGVNGVYSEFDNISVKEVNSALITDRAFSTGPKINLGVTALGYLTATAYDGTTTRTVTTTAAYNTATWTKARATYTTDGTLAIMVNGVNVASTTGAPLLTLNNASAVLTIGNSYALDAPFPGSIALLKLSATVPTQEQATWMYEQEKHLFTAGAQCVLPSSGNVLDLAYDDETDTWSALQATHESTWSGLVRTGTQTPSAGSFAKAAATSGIKLLSRTTTNPGVDVQIPARNLKAELARKREVLNANQDVVVFDYFGGFTATTTNGSTALTSVAASLYPSTTNLIGCAISGTGIPASTVITGISGTTIYMSKAATANGSTIQISTTDFNLPVGYTARAVMTAGTLKREGSTADYTKLFDGFKETIRYAVAHGHNAWVQIQAVKEVV
jgi:hypothetical protein